MPIWIAVQLSSVGVFRLLNVWFLIPLTLSIHLIVGHPLSLLSPTVPSTAVLSDEQAPITCGIEELQFGYLFSTCVWCGLIWSSIH